MKINKLIGAIASIALFSMMVASCGGSKAVPVDDGKIIKAPLSTKEYRSDANFFRVTNSGQSRDMATAKKIALLNARTELASNVASTIKAVTEQYINQVSIADKQEYAAKFEETARNVVNQELTNVTLKEEEIHQAKDGTYTYYVNIEMPKNQISESVANAIAKDEKMALEFDKFMFQKTFDAEMAKFENK